MYGLLSDEIILGVWLVQYYFSRITIPIQLVGWHGTPVISIVFIRYICLYLLIPTTTTVLGYGHQEFSTDVENQF